MTNQCGEHGSGYMYGAFLEDLAALHDANTASAVWLGYRQLELRNCLRVYFCFSVAPPTDLSKK